MLAKLIEFKNFKYLCQHNQMIHKFVFYVLCIKLRKLKKINTNLCILYQHKFVYCVDCANPLLSLKISTQFPIHQFNLNFFPINLPFQIPKPIFRFLFLLFPFLSHFIFIPFPFPIIFHFHFFKFEHLKILIFIFHKSRDQSWTKRNTIDGLFEFKLTNELFE